MMNKNRLTPSTPQTFHKPRQQHPSPPRIHSFATTMHLPIKPMPSHVTNETPRAKSKEFSIKTCSNPSSYPMTSLKSFLRPSPICVYPSKSCCHTSPVAMLVPCRTILELCMNMFAPKNGLDLDPKKSVGCRVA